MLKMVGVGFHTHAITDRLECEEVDLRFNIKEQAETIAGLRNTKGELDHGIGNVHLCFQEQTEMIGRLDRDLKTAAPNLTSLAEI